MLETSFTRSIFSQQAASCVIAVAKKYGIIFETVTVNPELAQAEQQLMLEVTREIIHRCQVKPQLDPDEISGLFTFMYIRAAEAAGCWINKKEQKFDMRGLFGGKIPFYLDETIGERFKELAGFPAEAAEQYLQWFASCKNCSNPLLPFFEALKWCFRLSCHFALTEMEKLACQNQKSE